jgi:CRP/FNR family transcriptional regulator, cyclic AMP receptor protein
MHPIAEKLLLLRNVSIFAELPDPVLVPIAKVLTEIEYPLGSSIFEKGDAGTCLYIIAAGRVRVHDGARTLNELGTWDVFGELAVLDPQPRMASVTALTPVRLFRIDRDTLYTLMASQVQVVQGIMHILVQYLRARVRDMADDFTYLQQFARVTAAAAAVEAGVYAPDSLDEVAQRTDQLGQLARVFQRMVREVDAREQRLQHAVAELRIEIDQVKTATQVTEITDNAFFLDLQEKARKLRSQGET